MRHVSAVLRLQWGQGRSERTIAQRLGLSRPAVAASVRRAQAAGVSWPLPEPCDAGALERFAPLLGVYRWVTFASKERLAPLCNAPLCPQLARQRCRVAQRFSQDVRATHGSQLSGVGWTERRPQRRAACCQGTDAA